MIKTIIYLLVGYFIGMISCLLQIIILEKHEDRMIRDILENKR